jgi:DNA-binding transcriptional ArsR family regulator
VLRPKGKAASSSFLLDKSTSDYGQMTTVSLKHPGTARFEYPLDHGASICIIVKVCKEVDLSSMPKSDSYKRRASMLSALACPARLHLLDALSRGEMGVGDLSSQVGLELSTVSRHLAVLRNSRLVKDRKEGTRVYYAQTAPCVMDFLDCIEKVLSGDSCAVPRPEIEGDTR